MALTSLIFFVAVLATTDGLNCFGQFCQGNEYCFIKIHEGSGNCVIPHGHQQGHQQCIGLHHGGDHCYCHEQACVDSMVRQEATPGPTNAPPIATAAPTVVTVAQTTAVPRIEVFTCFGTTCITPKVCRVMFVNAIPISGSCELPKANVIGCIPPPSSGDCNCDSRLCTGIIDTLTTQATSQASTATTPMAATDAVTDQVTTIGLTSTVSDGTTPLTLCADLEDAKFNCKDYNNQFGLCASLTSTLQTIARTRCPKFCNLCVNGTAPTQSTLTGTTTLPPCSDHDPRCSQASYKNLLCNPNAVPDTKKYAIETCPLTCNYCTEYYALLNPTVTCNICGDLAGRIPCSQSLVFKNITTTTTCPSSQQYCMTDVLQDSSGNKDIFKRCVDEATCRTKWLTESADQDYCSKYDVVKNPNAFECHFCCHGDYCNTGIKPKDSVLVQKQSGK
ncbi:uncharacterized protein LOC143064571 [Mytilus galloprovincialis]|uniref:uncharacterized protein LOC143064571 n=1 Tax=Mytilus galloprovincialis TaxID=29158 RepID=UPI003F7C5B5C